MTYTCLTKYSCKAVVEFPYHDLAIPSFFPLNLEHFVTSQLDPAAHPLWDFQLAAFLFGLIAPQWQLWQLLACW